MKPWPPLFETLADAGQGLLAWTGLAIGLLGLRGGLAPSLEGVQLTGLAGGLLLSAAALAPSFPARRAGVQALALAAPPTLATMALLLWMPAGATRAAWLACLGLLVAMLAIAACVRLALPPSGAGAPGRDPLPLAIQLLRALLCGLALQAVTMAVLLVGQGMAAMLPMLMLLGLVLVLMMWLQGRADATGPAALRRLAVAASLLVALPMAATLLLAAGWIGTPAAAFASTLGTLAGSFAWRRPAADARTEAPGAETEQDRALALDR